MTAGFSPRGRILRLSILFWRRQQFPRRQVTKVTSGTICPCPTPAGQAVPTGETL